MQPSTPATRHFDAIARWAKSVAPERWKNGPPEPGAPGYFAVRTASGRILVGSARAFRPVCLTHLENTPKYGRVVAHLAAGD